MTDKPTPEETATWQRRLASQANNRAWALSENKARTPAEDEEMLQAAYAAMYFWGIVGNANNHALAALLMAHVHALLRHGPEAKRYFTQVAPTVLADTAEAWQLALSHAVAANVASANGDASSHRTHHTEAVRRTDALPDPQDREVVRATLDVVPVPT